MKLYATPCEDRARAVALGTKTNAYRVVHPKSDIGVYIKAKSIVRLHGHVMCHINGNFVGFQNMYDLKMSDY